MGQNWQRARPMFCKPHMELRLLQQMGLVPPLLDAPLQVYSVASLHGAYLVVLAVGGGKFHARTERRVATGAAKPCLRPPDASVAASRPACPITASV